MNSRESLQGVSPSGLIQQWLGFGQNPGASRREISGRLISRPLRFLYWVYEQWLLRQLQQGSMPRHIGIILDGNRRHARRWGSAIRAKSISYGANKLDETLDWCAELGIAAVTLWVFSTENLKRSPAEVSGILAAIETKIAALADDPFMHQKRIRVRAIGRLDILPDLLIAAIRAAEAATAKYDLTTLTIAAAYGGREEIVDAVRRFLATQVEQGRSLTDVVDKMTSDDIGRHLYAADLPDPDLIIRTSGEIRLSGFCSGRACTANFTLQMCYGRLFAK